MRSYESCRYTRKYLQLIETVTAVVFTKSRVFNTRTIDLIFQIFFLFTPSTD